ncbi:MAG TPA: LuxR C-terminal-related transcriptional regulator, partial [Longimicrobiales bacterium]|nr:LuxR C-terminal-related transcriptional regulator [Longimicrobiales bacterium]
APWAAAGFPPWRHVVRAEALARLGRSEQALAAADELAGLGGEGSYPWAMALRIEGLAHDALDEFEEAIASLSRSHVAFSRLGMPFEAARAGIEGAEVALRVGRADGLADPVRKWLDVAVVLGAQRYAARARRLLHALGRPAPATATDGDLTSRQREVAELVAEGLTNAEIARALFISVRTVESHLDHIYTRLGINSRAALASYVTARR